MNVSPPNRYRNRSGAPARENRQGQTSAQDPNVRRTGSSAPRSMYDLPRQQSRSGQRPGSMYPNGTYPNGMNPAGQRPDASRTRNPAQQAQYRNPGDPVRQGTAPGQRQNVPSGSGMYNVNAAQRQRLARMQEDARRRSQARTGQPGDPAGSPSVSRGASVPGGTYVPGGTSVPGGTFVPRTNSPYNPPVQPRNAPPVRQDPPQSATPGEYGVRVRSVPEGGRYGNHSSYRTSDGRILDGFDKSGRPIYREAGTDTPGVVVHRAAFTPDTMRRLHPARRVRVETLADTEVKPFPWKIVLTVLFCTALSMAVLYTYMELNECTNSVSNLTYRLTGLRNRYNTLSAELVQREDLIAIEETASSTLGMVKNDILTKRYVSIENEDKTELVIKAAEAAKRRTSVEIDLLTGKPVGASGTAEQTDRTEDVPS